MASIVDRPKESTEGDLLEIEKYTNGLIKFIESSATPITIGVQGEWGSGKTSLLNTIKEDLCDKDGAKHYPIWLNTWEYSLLSSPDETLIKIISGLVNQIGDLTKNQNSENGKKAAAALGSLMKGFGGVMGGFSGKAIEMAGDVLESSSADKSSDNSIKALRVALQDVIDEAIKNSNGSKRAFIFFIDDLDRLDPSVAVNILELIKNLFDLNNCIFVLAIDYGVVVKGLQSKFGKMTEENEWEFRAFFDKIIQLPFSMPISDYNIAKYLQSLLVDVNYFDKNDLENEEALSKISEIVGLSVGTNPRTLKRLANSVSLIEIIRGDQKITSDERFIEFALICIQIAYPLIYTLIQKESDFTSWSDQFVYSVLKNKKIDEADLEALKETDEFDEEWEQNIWKICQISSFLKQRVYQLSKLLNFIKDNIPKNNDEEMNETLDRLLSMSSVTSVSADSTASRAREKHQKIKYGSWEEYTSILKGNNIPNTIITKVKEIVDEMKATFGDEVQINYTNAMITFRNIHTKGRIKVFSSIKIQQKKIIFGIFIIDKDEMLQYPNAKLHGKHYIEYILDKENNFDFIKYMPFVKAGFNELGNK